ncbi:hypothetical protein RND81_14G113800 [Saponaria officinalis]|uniref:KIB1-4 beta-propeller domain-containing protein n=1 Tax=Saponaria officinalis TaxID=3572 RepID=A0AAW1GLU4_SAPOF
MLRIPAIDHPESCNPYSLRLPLPCDTCVGFLVYKLGHLCELFIWFSLSSINNATLSVGKSCSWLCKSLSFPCVCRNWRSARQYRFQEMNMFPNMFIRKRLPMLLISTDSAERRNVYSLPDGQVYHLKLPVPYNTRCIGSSHGWLVFIEIFSYVITLFNPFYFGDSKGTIRLPAFLPAKDFFESAREYELNPEYYIAKAVLSADPISCPNYTVMLIHGEYKSLAYYKSGDETWTCIPGNPLIHDLIYHNGRFRALCLWGELYTSDPEANRPQLESVSEPLYGQLRSSGRRYIVMSNDGHTLFQLVRNLRYRLIGDGNVLYQTVSFSVYKLGCLNETFDWLQLSSIGDAALFVGDSYSYCVKASDFSGITPNSIYFTDDFHGFGSVYRNPYQFEGANDMGVFLIGDGSLRSHYDPGDTQKHLVPPIWIMPTI